MGVVTTVTINFLIVHNHRLIIQLYICPVMYHKRMGLVTLSVMSEVAHSLGALEWAGGS